MIRVFGIALIVLALALAIVPHYTDCQSQGDFLTLANGKTASMKCHWAGVSEIAVGAPLAVVGVMMAVPRQRKQSLMMLGIMGIVFAAVAISLPTFIIGTCGMPTHICNTTMKPFILTMGSLAAVASIGAMISGRKLKA